MHGGTRAFMPCTYTEPPACRVQGSEDTPCSTPRGSPWEDQGPDGDAAVLGRLPSSGRGSHGCHRAAPVIGVQGRILT